MITHIGTVAVYVENQEAALRFWLQQVGFELKADRPMTDTIRWYEVGPSGGDTALVVYPKTLMADWHERKPSVVFVMDDVERTCADLAANEVTISQPVVEMAWGKFAAFLDPEGNEFALRA
jgi:predicted enzyme related to lactoylglutathione lyase